MEGTVKAYVTAAPAAVTSKMITSKKVFLRIT